MTLIDLAGWLLIALAGYFIWTRIKAKAEAKKDDDVLGIKLK